DHSTDWAKRSFAGRNLSAPGRNALRLANFRVSATPESVLVLRIGSLYCGLGLGRSRIVADRAPRLRQCDCNGASLGALPFVCSCGAGLVFVRLGDSAVGNRFSVDLSLPFARRAAVSVPAASDTGLLAFPMAG